LSVLPVGFGSAVAGGYQIQRSLRFNSADSAYLNRTPASDTNRTTWTVSFWVKRGALGSRQEILGNINSIALNGVYIEFLADDTFQFGEYASTLWNWQLITTAVFRDPSAWYHIVLSADTTQATNTNRFKIYVNGVQVTVFGTSSYPSQNFNTAWNTTQPISIGRNGQYNALYLNSYLTEIYNIDGLTPNTTTRTVNGVTQTILTELGQFNANTGVWEPAAWTRAFGTNGFYVNFSDNSNTTAATLGKDYSGNGNNWTPNNFLVTAGAGNDSLVDSPTAYGTDTGAGGEVRGNYATWNSLINGDSAANGNLDVTNDTARSTQVLLQFDTYWEITSTGGTTTAGTVSGTGTTNTTTIASTKTYGFRLTTAGTLDYKNITDGGSFTNITTGLTSQQFIYASAAAATTGSLNAGQRPFAATAPSGFKALVTTNLLTPTIGATSTTQAGKYFNPVLYTGNGATQSITGVGFQPDWVWVKSRNSSGTHSLTDAVRGVNKQLFTNLTNAEGSQTDQVTAFNSDGFSLGANVAGTGSVNVNTVTYVAWNWKANGAGASNTNGSITSTVSANTTSGFSIVTYTGTSANATVGHGLGATPAMIIVKNRDSGAIGGAVYHTSMGATKYLKLFQTTTGSDGEATDNTAWNGSSPTFNTNVFSVGSLNRTNSSQQMVAYCFASVAGYSAFGSYTGNGSADGPFVYTGFRPRYVMIKVSSTTSSWNIIDTARNPSNLVTQGLYADLADVEDSTRAFDILSNGFKMRSATVVNANTATYIYAAFAEAPFKYSLAR